MDYFIYAQYLYYPNLVENIITHMPNGNHQKDEGTLAQNKKISTTIAPLSTTIAHPSPPCLHPTLGVCVLSDPQCATLPTLTQT